MGPAVDMTTLARLHAALDFIVDAEQMLGEIRESQTSSSPAITRVGQLLGESRDLLRGLLARTELDGPDRRFSK